MAILFVHSTNAQSIVVDSALAETYRIQPAAIPAKKEENTKSSKKGDKSFVGLMENLGKGLLNKLKRRFNLEEIKEKVDNTREKVKDTFKSKKQGGDKTPDTDPTSGAQNKGSDSG